MTQHEASRTLVKSPPELWAECSDATSLARHLGQSGEIRITRLEPETAVAWEGEEISGTVRLEPSGWGTRVILTAQRPDVKAASEPEPEFEPQFEPEPEPEPEPEKSPADRLEVTGSAPGTPRNSKRGALAWLRDFFGFGPVGVQSGRATEPVVLEPVPALAAPAAAELATPVDAVASVPDEALSAALDSLGQAHHRPFSRG